MPTTAAQRRRRALQQADRAEPAASPAVASSAAAVARWRPAPTFVTAEPLRRLADGTEHRDPLGGAPIPDSALAELSRGRGRGGALPGAIRDTAEDALGADLSGVRLHTDAHADALARSVQSVAFTHGQDVYFSAGSYQPRGDAGSRLLAHELSHVAQEAAGARGAGGTIGRADDAAEAHAERTADRIAPALRRSTGASAYGPSAGAESRNTTSHPVGAPLQRTALRRKISAGSADIAATRPEKRGLKKLTGAKDSLDKLGKLLDLYRGISDQKKQVAALPVIIGLAEQWLAKHHDPGDAPSRVLLEEILAEARRDQGQARAQQIYLNDMRAGEWVPHNREGSPHEQTNTAFTQNLSVSMASKGRTALEQAAPSVEHKPGSADNAAAELIRAAGLTEAEIIAIKMYTESDYLYINPATANDQAWLEGQLPAIQGTADALARSVRTEPGARNAQMMQTEGVTHAGVMMQGLAKLERKKGITYRGARMTPAKFDETYGTKTHLTYPGFTSTGLDESTADAYAAGGGIRKPGPDQTVSVKCYFEVNDARDIKDISEIRNENEWLLLPGASFEITRVVDVGPGKPGKPGVTQATAWKEVHLKQVSPKEVPADTTKPLPAPASMQKLAARDFSVPAARRPRPVPAAPRPTLGPSSALAMQNLARGRFGR